MKSYLSFQYEMVYGKKTKVVSVLNSRSGVLLGTIKWFSRWRQYTFFPEPDTIFSVGCMQEIQDQVSQLQDEWKNTKRLHHQLTTGQEIHTIIDSIIHMKAAFQAPVKIRVHPRYYQRVKTCVETFMVRADVPVGTPDKIYNIPVEQDPDLNEPFKIEAIPCGRK